MAVDQNIRTILSRIETATKPRAALARTLAAASASERLAEMLDEIASAILPRVLTFTTGAGATCQITVRSGRVYGLSGIAEATDPSDEGRAARLRLIVETLRGFAQADGPLLLDPHTLPDNPDMDGIGHTARELRRICDTEGWLPKDTEDASCAPLVAETPVEQMPNASANDAVGPHAVARLAADGQVIEMTGMVDLMPDAAILTGLVAELTEWRAAKDADFDGPIWIVMRDVTSDAAAFGLCATPDAITAQIIKPDQIPALAADWIATQAGGDKA